MCLAFILGCPKALALTFGFVTAAVFEAVSVHRWQNEFKKTKLNTNTSPAAGTNLVLCICAVVNRNLAARMPKLWMWVEVAWL